MERKVKNKRPCIKIYYEDKKKENAVVYLVKHYIHPENVLLNAHVRQLSASERYAATAAHDNSSILITMNSRELNNNMFVEFKNKTYQLTGTDELDFTGTEIKVYAKNIVPKKYSKIEYEEWNT